MIIASIRMLGAKTYNSALLFTKNTSLDDHANIELLKSFGITHLVAGREQFYRKIKHFAVTDPVKIGGYRIVQIQRPPSEKIAPVDKSVIGYLDLKGNLPFHLVEFYFYARKRLSENFELVKIENKNAIPLGLSGLLVNHDEGKVQLGGQWEAGDRRVTEINFSKPYLLDHYKPHYPHNVEIDAYHEIEKYLGNVVNLPRYFIETFGMFNELSTASKQTPSLTWSNDNQKMRLNNLEPGQMYRINYSYFPYWRSPGGIVLRGSGERMFFVAEDTSATLEYRKWGFTSTILGYLLTLVAWGFIGMKVKGRKSYEASVI